MTSVLFLGTFCFLTTAPAAMAAIGGAPFLRPKETLTGHEGPVWSLAVSDRYLYSGSSDKTLKVV